MTTSRAESIVSMNFAQRGRSSSIVARFRRQGSAATRFICDQSPDSEFLRSHGFLGFEDFWNLPHRFVDDINYRKGGWSGVSLLSLREDNTQRNYYVKRQVNQFRHSFSRPFGALTFEYEALAIERSLANGLPSVDIACWGVRKEAGSTMGLLVTPEIGLCSLENILATQKFSPALGVLLFRCGEQLLQMHNCGLQHGALYPKHIYVDQQSGDIQLIDFERARKKSFVRSAIRADLRQLLKHLKTLPFEVSEMLLGPYQLQYSKLVSELQA